MKIENYNGNFVDIEGFEDYYMISDIGTVYSKKSKKLLSPRKDGAGYLRVSLYLNGTVIEKHIHKLVAEAFIEKPSEEHTDIHHLNRCKTDNRVENLSRLTHSEHRCVHLEASKTRVPVKCLETGKTYNSILAAANDLGLKHGNISRHLQGVHKHVKGYHFEKVDIDNEI